MRNSDVFNIVEAAFNKAIAEKLLHSYINAEKSYLLGRWQECELSCGHFAESLRRILDFELFGSYTPYGKTLSSYNDAVIKKYQQAEGHESFRIVLPRVLNSILSIRNKRGVGHIGEIDPNEMDATLLFNLIKWCLAELIRLKSSLAIDQTQDIIHQIIERKIELIWKNGEVRRVLNHSLGAKEQVLLLLYEKSLSIEELLHSIEYSSLSNFRKRIIEKLHRERYIEYDPNSTKCQISPTGIILAEGIFENNIITK